jgi:hypothetical protein
VSHNKSRVLLKYREVCVTDFLCEAAGVMSCLYFDFTLTILGELCKSHGMHCGVDELNSLLN